MSESRPKDSIEAAVFDVFLERIHRPPTHAERASWVAKLLRGTPIRALHDALSGMQVEKQPQEKRTPDAAAAAIAATGLFDPAWYVRRYPDIGSAGIDPLEHYSRHGAGEDRDPNPYFDPLWYRDTNQIPRDQAVLTHYAIFGEPAGLAPSTKFDPAWYRAAYDLPEAASPLADFLRRRHKGEVAPSAALWPALGRPRPEGDGPMDDVFLGVEAFSAGLTLLRDTGLFDENYYALHSGDVLSAGTDMLTHYCEFGWREHRQPNFYFDCRWYAATNPDVERLGVNPLAHYLLVGEKAGRRPVVFFDPAWYRQTNAIPAGQSPLGHFLTHRREGTMSPNEYFDPVWYAARKGGAPRPGRDPFARFLVAGLTEDIAPSARFDLAAWRRQSMGRVSRHFRHLLDPARDNPLVHYLLSTYR